MRSYERAAIFSRASRPFLAVSTSYPSSPRISAMIAATSGSSSTTRMQMRQASALCFCSVGIGKVTSGQEQQARGHYGTVEKPDAYCDLPSVLFPKWSLMVPSRARARRAGGHHVEAAPPHDRLGRRSKRLISHRRVAPHHSVHRRVLLL